MNTVYDKDDLQTAVRTLREGGVILYPTDTVWGIGCDATNSAAVQKVYKLKQRSDSKAVLVLIDHEAKLSGLMREVPELAYNMIDLAVRPLTIIYPAARNIAPELLAEDGSLGIRISKENFSHELCRMLGRPVVSTSANISGEPSPACFAEISQKIKEGVDYIVRYRQDDRSKALPSQIIKLEVDGQVKVIRE
ncbi:Sua5 YciO YrdC YwlC family protein [Porphyromonas crevioricanis JCM 15906]|uniref:L-threonylcarbamoyladenylate synthase n=1 Tax=Porphyromonas crevioricanis JCM 15906 TaxID=1305617 RepID=T1CHI0_9PORP|nr:L-threonylcarbamoyladenylate synthase [Porphyromonas crevioricanis]GAD05366.1 Sua5 YciO YrdC YwlC family protein [Porphyromonas crevioricanis JCM 15906]SJZ85338.1 translation factor SUA5 [Porphyromonas crevioricanis]